MANRKKIRTRGKLPLSKYFQNLEQGQKVAIVSEKSVSSNFPSRMQGRTGIVQGKRGRSCIVLINDNKKPKTYIIEPIHLKKIKNKQ